MDDYFSKTLTESQVSWRNVVTTAIKHGIPIPAMSAALSYYDGYRCPRLPANLLQVGKTCVLVFLAIVKNFVFVEGSTGLLWCPYL